jgi:Fe-S-cluster containining protein
MDEQDINPATGLMYELIDGCTAAMLRLAAMSGHTIACSRGCSTCCDHYVPATYAEAVPIVLLLLEPSNKIQLSSLIKAVGLRRDILGPEVAIMDEYCGRSEGPPLKGADGKTYLSAAGAYRRRGLMCPFNAPDGSCAIYPVRPVPCRTYYVAGSPDFCSSTARRAPTRIKHPTLTHAAKLAREVLLGLSAEAGYPGCKPLPEAVFAALSTGMGVRP